MVAKTGSGTRGGTRSRRSQNKNAESRNQNSGPIVAVRESPLAAAAVIGGAVAAGVFLWSRRNEISDQIRNLADQISEWRDALPVQTDGGGQTASAVGSVRRGESSDNRRSQREIAEEALTLKQMGEPA